MRTPSCWGRAQKDLSPGTVGKQVEFLTLSDRQRLIQDEHKPRGMVRTTPFTSCANFDFISPNEGCVGGKNALLPTWRHPFHRAHPSTRSGDGHWPATCLGRTHGDCQRRVDSQTKTASSCAAHAHRCARLWRYPGDGRDVQERRAKSLTKSS